MPGTTPTAATRALPLARAQALISSITAKSPKLKELNELLPGLEDKDVARLTGVPGLTAIVRDDMAGTDQDQAVLALTVIGWILHRAARLLGDDAAREAQMAIVAVFDASLHAKNAVHGKAKALLCVWALTQCRSPLDSTLAPNLVDVAFRAMLRHQDSLTMLQHAAELLYNVTTRPSPPGLLAKFAKTLGAALIYLVSIDGSFRKKQGKDDDDDDDDVARVRAVRVKAAKALTRGLVVFWEKPARVEVSEQVRINKTWDAIVAFLARAAKDEGAQIDLAESLGPVVCLLGPLLDDGDVAACQARLAPLVDACMHLFNTPATCQRTLRSWRLYIENHVGFQHRPRHQQPIAELRRPLHYVLSLESADPAARTEAFETFAYMCLFDGCHPDARDVADAVNNHTQLDCLLLALRDSDAETSKRAARFAAQLVSGKPVELRAGVADAASHARVLAMEHALGLKGPVPCIYHHTQHATRVLLATVNKDVWTSALGNPVIAPEAMAALPRHSGLARLVTTLGSALAPSDALGLVGRDVLAPAVAANIFALGGGASRVVLESDWSALAPARARAEAFRQIVQSRSLSTAAVRRCLELAFDEAHAWEPRGAEKDWLKTPLEALARLLREDDAQLFSVALVGLIAKCPVSKLQCAALLSALPPLVAMAIDGPAVIVADLARVLNRLLLVVDSGGDPLSVWHCVKPIFNKDRARLLRLLGHADLAVPASGELSAPRLAFWSQAMLQINSMIVGDAYAATASLVDLARVMRMALACPDLSELARTFWGSREPLPEFADVLRKRPRFHKRSLSVVAASSSQSDDGLTEHQREAKRVSAMATYTTLDGSQSMTVPPAPSSTESASSPPPPPVSTAESPPPVSTAESPLVDVVRRLRAEFKAAVAASAHRPWVETDADAAVEAHEFALELLHVARPARR